MITRRLFLKQTLNAGIAFSCGLVNTGCSGLKRSDITGTMSADSGISLLDPVSRSILHHASLAPSGHNSQPWRVRIERPDLWIIEVDRDRCLPAVDPKNRELLLSIGAFSENLVLAAGNLGVRTDITVTATDFHDREVLRVDMYKGNSTGYPLERLKLRRTIRKGMISKELASSDLSILSAGEDSRFFYFPGDSSHGGCIRDLALESFCKQSCRDSAQAELIQWLRLSDKDSLLRRDGLTVEGMEIKGLKGWFVRHFVNPGDFMKESFRRQGEDVMEDLVQEGGGWIVMTSPGEKPADLIETGRRFERMALLAREAGIGIHPMSQILEEESGLTELAVQHGGSFFPQFVLRVGYCSAYPEPVSLRRPVAWFTDVAG